MQHLEVSGAVRPIYGSLGVRRLTDTLYAILPADGVNQCFSTAGPWPGAGPWNQLYWAARGSPGICHFSFVSNFQG